MLAQNFHLSLSLSDDLENNTFVVGKRVRDIEIAKDFLSSLQTTHALLVELTVIGEDNIVQLEDENKILLKNAIVQSKQVISPSVLDTIVSTNNSQLDERDIYGLLQYAFVNKFKSTIVKYIKLIDDKSKLIDHLVYQYLDRFDLSDMITFIVSFRHYYTPTKDNNRLLAQAAMCKNYNVCEFLLEKYDDAMIPQNVFNAFKEHGNHRYQHMWKLLKQYSDRVS